METFMLFAKPWWVNLFIFIPIIAYLGWFRRGLELSKKKLLLSALFGITFGFIETSVVIYLRALLSICEKSLVDVGKTIVICDPGNIAKLLPENLASIEILRETATIFILAIVSFIVTKKFKERWAIFFWLFAFWDIFYYIFLKLAINWPTSFFTDDLLFLIPVPWFSQIWFPISISILLILAILARKKPDCE